MENNIKTAKGKILIDGDEQMIIHVAMKTNKLISEVLKEPLNYILATYHVMQFNEQINMGNDLLRHFSNQSKKI